jgi:hypothetical protein
MMKAAHIIAYKNFSSSGNRTFRSLAKFQFSRCPFKVMGLLLTKSVYFKQDGHWDKGASEILFSLSISSIAYYFLLYCLIYEA